MILGSTIYGSGNSKNMVHLNGPFCSRDGHFHRNLRRLPNIGPLSEADIDSKLAAIGPPSAIFTPNVCRPQTGQRQAQFGRIRAWPAKTWPSHDHPQHCRQASDPSWGRTANAWHPDADREFPCRTCLHRTKPIRATRTNRSRHRNMCVNDRRRTYCFAGAGRLRGHGEVVTPAPRTATMPAQSHVSGA